MRAARAAASSAAALLVAGALVSSCSPRNNGTLLVVRVDTDLAIPGELSQIALDIQAAGGAKTTDTFALGSRATLPITFGIRPKGTPDISIDVTARGLLGTTAVVNQAATVRFVPGQAQEFTLFLSRDCAVTSNPCPATGAVCAKGPRCIASKADVAVLKPYTPGGPSDGGAGDAAGGAGGARDGGGGAGGTGGTGGNRDGGGDSGGDARDAGGGRDARPNTGMWVTVASPNPQATLNAVWAVAVDDVIAVGALGGSAVVYRLRQNAWSELLIAGTSALYGVWASAADDVWAVGYAGVGVRFAGSNMPTIMSVPALPGENVPPTLTAVWGSSAEDVWVVGARGVIYHGGRAGTPQMVVSGTTADLNAVWGTSATEVWAVGSGGTVVRRSPVTNNIFAPVPQALSTAFLNGVWLAGPTDVWAIGIGVAIHYDGMSWTRATIPLDVGLGVWGSATDDVWAVGRGTTSIARWNGVAWVSAASPVTTALQSVRGSSFTNVWAVGGAGTVLRLQPTP